MQLSEACGEGVGLPAWLVRACLGASTVLGPKVGITAGGGSSLALGRLGEVWAAQAVRLAAGG